MTAVAVLSIQSGNVAFSLLCGVFTVLGVWSFGTFPLGFCVVEKGIQVERPIGARTIEWREITRISRMPGPFRWSEAPSGRRGVTRQAGTLMLVVGRRRISISSVKEPSELRDELIAEARQQGVEVMPAVFGSEWSS